MNHPRRSLLAAGLFAPALASAQARFPERPVTLICPFPPGGTTDVTLRALAEATGRHLGQNVVVENRPGAANTLGAATVARARPDGYTITQMPASAIRVQLLQTVPYDTLRDFTPILGVTGYAFMSIAKAGRFPGGWPQVIAEARANPGKLSYGSTGVNGTPHVALAELFQRERVELTHVPFRGDADSGQAVLGGHVDLIGGASSLGNLAEGGQASILNVWSAARLKRFPQAPTLRDLGYDMVVTTPYGLVGPAGMDPVVTKVLHDAFAAGAREASHLAALERFDMALEYRNSAAYAAFLRESVAGEQQLIERLGLRAG